MKTNELRVKVTLKEDMLGTASADPDIYASYIASKSPNPEQAVSEEVKTLPDDEQITENETESKTITVFHRNPETGEPIIYDYLIKGFFKNACGALREVEGTKSKTLKSYKKKIDNLVFIKERMIDINKSGEMSICSRPLRASTPQGERVALASSESIPAGSTMEFTIIGLTKEIMDFVIEWLDYGKFNGLGQWHNSGKGRFTWKDIGCKE